MSVQKRNARPAIRIHCRWYVWLVVLAALGGAESRGQTILEKEELLAVAEAKMSLIGDMTVTCSSKLLTGPPEDLSSQVEETVTIKGVKTLIDKQFGPAEEMGKGLIRRRVAFNGEQSTTYNVGSGDAIVSKERFRESHTQDCNFFDMNLLNPSKGAPGGDLSLLSLLTSEDTAVRPALEEVGGRPCHVVDVITPGVGTKYATYWLDLERSLAPMRHVYFFGDDGAILVDFIADEVAEVANGLWLVVQGRKIVHPLIDSLPDSGYEHLIQVVGWQEGEPELAVNSGVQDEIFDLWKNLPPGTLILDKDEKKSGSVSGNNFASIAESAQETAALYRHTIEDGTPGGSGSTSFGGWWLALAGAGAAGICLGLLSWWRYGVAN